MFKWLSDVEYYGIASGQRFYLAKEMLRSLGPQLKHATLIRPLVK